MQAAPDRRALREIALFHGLSDKELSQISDLLHRKIFPAGSSIINIEQPGEVVYLIVEGTVKIHIGQADGSDVILAILGPGETVGEMSMLGNTGRCANVVTLEPTTVLWMDRRAFRDCLKTIPAIGVNLISLLAARLRVANEQIQALAAHEVESRVARQILAFAQRYGRQNTDGGIRIPIRLTQSDIAGLVGASRERTNQVIVAYKKLKYLSVDRSHHITVLNREALVRRCD